MSHELIYQLLIFALHLAARRGHPVDLRRATPIGGEIDRTAIG